MLFVAVSCKNYATLAKTPGWQFRFKEKKAVLTDKGWLFAEFVFTSEDIHYSFADR